MKRILLVAVSSSALVLAAPAIASAHHHGKHHHKRHAARARVLDFRASKPATPATPTTPTNETVGKVTSFKEGVLIITLTNGTQVTGKVTEKTEIHCPSTATPSTNGDDDEQGDSGGDQGSSSVAHASCNGQQGEGSDQQSCTPAALTEGAPVREAELTLTGEGAVWDKVDLA